MKKREYLDLARELEKKKKKSFSESDGDTISNWRACKFPGRGLEELEIGGRAETIQTITLLRSANILKRVLET